MSAARVSSPSPPTCDLCPTRHPAYPVARFELRRTPAAWIKWLCEGCARSFGVVDGATEAVRVPERSR